MPVSVKEYLSSMKSIGTGAKPNVSNQNDVKLQVLLAQLIEALAYANSMKFSKKDLNSVAKGTNPDKQTGKEVLQQIKAQEALIEQLSKGEQLSKEQNEKLLKAIDKFYEMAGAQEINYKKFASILEQHALNDNLPEPVRTRVINDSRDAHIIGQEQKRSEGPVLPILKKIKYLLEDGAENTKQFGKKLFVTLDAFRESLIGAFDNLKENLDGGGLFGKIVDGIKMVGLAWMAFKGQFDEGNFKWGQGFKQLMTIPKAFKAIEQAGGLGKAVESAKNMAKGMKTILSQFKFLPKLIQKFGFGKGLGMAAKGVGKGLAKGLGKGALKKIPGIGLIMSLWMTVERWKQKDYAGALIELASGVASIFPGIGTAVSVGLDLINLGRDTGFFKNIGEKGKEAAKGAWGAMGDNVIMSIPGVGPIYGLMKAVRLFKSGNKKGGLLMVGKSIASIAPGGAWLADVIVKLMGMNKDISPDTSGSGNSSSGFNWKFWQNNKNKKDQKGAGDNLPQYGSGDSSGSGSSTFANNLAQAAIARGGGTTTSGGRCALAVGDAFSKVVGEKEASKYRGNAWQWIDKLKGIGAKYFKFAGVAGSNKEMKGVPAGSIAVWNKQSAHPYGHIEIADGKGHLISDFKRNADLNLYRKNPAGIKPLIFTPKDMKMPKLSGSMKNPNGQDETSSAGDISDGSEEQSAEPQTFDEIMAAFSKFNEDIVAGVPSTTTGSASQIPTNTNIPSASDMATGTPAEATANATATTAKQVSKPPTVTPAPQPQVVQTTMGQGPQETMETEIRDTDLALLNSLLFQ